MRSNGRAAATRKMHNAWKMAGNDTPGKGGVWYMSVALHQSDRI